MDRVLTFITRKGMNMKLNLIKKCSLLIAVTAMSLSIGNAFAAPNEGLALLSSDTGKIFEAVGKVEAGKVEAVRIEALKAMKENPESFATSSVSADQIRAAKSTLIIDQIIQDKQMDKKLAVIIKNRGILKAALGDKATAVQAELLAGTSVTAAKDSSTVKTGFGKKADELFAALTTNNQEEMNVLFGNLKRDVQEGVFTPQQARDLVVSTETIAKATGVVMLGVEACQLTPTEAKSGAAAGLVAKFVLGASYVTEHPTTSINDLGCIMMGNDADSLAVVSRKCKYMILEKGSQIVCNGKAAAAVAAE